MLILNFQQLFSVRDISLMCKFSSELHRISVTFVNKDGSEKTISVPIGMSMLEAAHENDIELEGKSSYLENLQFPSGVIPFSACIVVSLCLLFFIHYL